MKYSKTEKFDPKFLKENIMGPNPSKLLEQLLAIHPIPPESTVLDLGCGRGITSIFLAQECQARVFAADLWITPTENYNRFGLLGLNSRQIIPILAEAHSLPFAEEFFDFVVSVDSYNFFGLDREYLGAHLLPLVKHGGFIMIAVPGLKKDIHSNLPPEMLLSWRPEDIDTLHDAQYWRGILECTKGIDILGIHEMQDFDECWNDWLSCDHEYAVHDRKAMEAGAGKYMNFISILIRRQ